VRNLEREIGAVCRKVATKVAEKGQAPGAGGGHAADLRDLPGPAQIPAEVAERVEIAGVATGLAWTPTGGDIMFFEATRMPGSKGLYRHRPSWAT
jgi:ATP-dependent Lon protease